MSQGDTPINSFEDLGWNGVLVGSDNDTVQSGWTVPNNIVDNAAYAGIELTNVNNSTVSGNVIVVSNGNWDAGDSGVGIEVAVRDHGSGVTTGDTIGVTVSDNTITGGGSGARAGINILSRAYQGTSNAWLMNVTIENNTINGVTPRGILVAAEQRNGGAASVAALQMSGNIVTVNEVGVAVGVPTGSSGVDGGYELFVNGNSVSGNTSAGVQNTAGVLFDAVNNWWGAPTGPTHASNPGGLGDVVSDNVTFSPWYINDTLTTLSGGASIVSDDPTSVDAGFTPEIGSILARGDTAHLGRTTTYIGSPLGTAGDTIKWKVTIDGPAALTADMVDLDEVGFLDPPDVAPSIGTFHYPFATTTNPNTLEAIGSCDVAGTHDNACTHVVGFSLDTNDVFTNADKILFNSSAPTGSYTITYELVNTDGSAVVGTHQVSVEVVDPASIVSEDPTLVDEGFAPEIGSILARDDTAYLGRTTTYTGPQIGLGDPETIKWKVTVDGPSALTDDMVDLDEVGWTDQTDFSTDAFHYPFTEVDGNLIAVGSCDDTIDVSGHVDTCDALVGFSLVEDDEFTNADKITFSSSAPNGPYTITYELINTADDSVLGTYAVAVMVVNNASDVTLSSSADGQADLPSGENEIILTNETVLDISNAVNTASGGNITVGGDSLALDGGVVPGVNLTLAQNIGGQAVTVEKAVKLASGSSGAPIVLTNSALSNASVSIPDGTTILAPSGWNGTIQPPKTGSSSGTAPSGFSVGSTVIEVGSPGAVLLFDNPVALTLTGVSGPVGYRPAGSTTWVSINDTCGGNYANPASPTFPDECKITNGTDTKIVTYHFTAFASLNAVSSGGGGGGGGGGAAAPPAPPAPDSEVLGIEAPHGNGTLVADGPTVYLVVNGQRRPFRNAAEYLSYGFNFSSVVPANSGDLALPQAGILKAMDGTLALDTSDNRTIYMIGSNGTKRGFVSAAVFRQLGYKFNQAVKLDLSDYQTGHPISSATVAHPDGTLVMSGKTIWWINNGQRHGFTSMDSFRSYGWTIGKVLKASAVDMALPEGSVVLPRTEALSTGGWLV